MQYVPSRREKREAKFIRTAEQGEFESSVYLFKNEAVNLRKKNFKVIRIGTDDKKSLPSVVSWEDAFNKGVPPAVAEYVVGKIQTFPKVSNWAQELYVVAARARYMEHKNNE